MNKHLLKYGVVGGVALAAFLVVAFGPGFVNTSYNAPPAALIGVAVLLCGLAALFAWPQFQHLIKGRAREQYRSSLPPVLEQGIGSADTTLDVPVQVEPAVREPYYAGLVQSRFPPASYTGKTKFTDNGFPKFVTQLTAGQDLESAIRFAEIEDPAIRAHADLVRSFLQTEFPATVPCLAVTHIGAHYDKGTTALRTAGFQGEVLSHEEARLSILNCFHQAQTRRLASPLQVNGSAPPEPEKQAEDGAKPRKNLDFLVPRPARVRVVHNPATELKSNGRRRSGPPTQRSHLLLRSWENWSHGLISLSRAPAQADVARVDRRARAATAVAGIACMWGPTMGAGLEAQRITKDAGCGIIGSFTDVYAVPSRSALTALTQRIRIHGVPTLAEYTLNPGDCDVQGNGRRVIMFAYGSPALVREVPETVRKALDLKDEEFFAVAAGVPNVTGAKFVLFIEASASELEAAFPGLTEQAGWQDFLLAVDHWNTIKSDQKENVPTEVPSA